MDQGCDRVEQCLQHSEPGVGSFVVLVLAEMTLKGSGVCGAQRSNGLLFCWHVFLNPNGFL